LIKITVDYTLGYPRYYILHFSMAILLYESRTIQKLRSVRPL